MAQPARPTPPWLFHLADEAKGIPRKLAEGITTRIFVGDHVMLSVVRIAPHSTGAIHSHPEEQWGVLLEGRCVRIQGGEEVEVQAGAFWRSPAAWFGWGAGAVLRAGPSRTGRRGADSGFGCY